MAPIGACCEIVGDNGQRIEAEVVGFADKTIYLMPFSLNTKRYFLGAIYQDCINPGQLKRQVVMIKEEMDRLFANELVTPKTKIQTRGREGFLFQEITDAEIDRLFSAGGI